MSETVKPGWFAPCERHLAAIHAKVDRLDEAIRGNGKPGILLRVDRLEQAGKRTSTLVWMVVGALVTSVSGILVAWALGVRP